MREKLNSKKINVLIIVSAVVPVLLLSGCTQQPSNSATNTVSIENLGVQSQHSHGIEWNNHHLGKQR